MNVLKSIAACILVGLMASCQNANPDKYASAESTAVAADETTAANIIGVSTDSVKLVKTGAMQLQVADADRAVREFSQLTQSLGGMVTHQSLEYQTVNSRQVALSADSLLLVTALAPQATVVARVPAQNLEAFLFGATDKSLYPLSRSLDIDDQSLAYLENALKSRNRTEALANPSGTKGFSKTDRVGMGDEAIDQAIANRRIDADVRYSTVSLQLTQHPIIRKETVVNTDVSAYRTPAGRRFGLALSEGGRLFVDFFFGLLNLWAFILIGIAVVVFYRYQKARRRAAVAAAAA